MPTGTGPLTLGRSPDKTNISPIGSNFDDIYLCFYVQGIHAGALRDEFWDARGEFRPDLPRVRYQQRRRNQHEGDAEDHQGPLRTHAGKLLHLYFVIFNVGLGFLQTCK